MNYREKRFSIDGHEALLQLYLWEELRQHDMGGGKRPLILICPGGGYSFVAGDENQTMAFRFLPWGYHTAVLHYSVRPAAWPVQLHQLALAVALIREQAEEWLIDPEKIVVMGFSAGGNLAGELGVHWQEKALADRLGLDSAAIRPNALVLGYPVLALDRYPENVTGNIDAAERRRRTAALKPGSAEADAPVRYVSEFTPPTFLWHTYEDKTVPVESSLLFAEAMIAHRRPVELHVYEKGPHGLCLATPVSENHNGLVNASAALWARQLRIWLSELFGESGSDGIPLYDRSRYIGRPAK